MSMLIEALARASREKQKAAGVPVEDGPGPQSAKLEPSGSATLELEFPAAIDAKEPAQASAEALVFPTLTLEEVPAPVVQPDSSVPVFDEQPSLAEVAPPHGEHQALAPDDGAPQASIETGLALEFREAEREDVFVSAERAPAKPLATELDAEPVAGDMAAVAESIASSAKSPAEVSESPAMEVKPVAASAAPDQARTAREIVSAAAGRPRPRLNKRLVLLGGVAALACIGVALMFSGLVDRFLGAADVAYIPPPVAEPAPVVPAAPQSASAESVSASTGGGRIPMTAAAILSDEAPRPRRAATESASTKGADFAEGRATVAPELASSPIRPQRVAAAKPSGGRVLDEAYVALNSGSFESAQQLYQRALDKNPGEMDALLGLAYIAHARGNVDAARSYYQRVLRLQTNHPTANAALLELGSEGSPALASRAMDLADRNPESPAALATLGSTLAKEGRIAEAQQAYFRALSLEPANAFHAYNLAVALDRLHKPELAQSYYRQALTLAERMLARDRAFFPRDAVVLRLAELSEATANASADGD